MVGSTSALFKGVRYNFKTTAELRESMERKLGALRGLIEEREQRVRKIRDEYEIDAERLAVLILRYQDNRDQDFVSYERQGSTDKALVPAGVIASLVRERQMIDSEREQIVKIELILRNIREEELYYEPRSGETKRRLTLHHLSDDELEYLGF